MSLAYARISTRKEEAHKVGKIGARALLADIIVNEVKWPNNTVRFLTLPGAHWRFEKDYVPHTFNGHRLSVTGCERDKQVFRYAALSMPRKDKVGLKTFRAKELNVDGVTNRKSVTLINCDIADFMAASPLKYDVIWLDYCGPICDYIMDGISMVNRVLNKPGLLGITVMRAREFPHYTRHIKRFGGRANYLEAEVKELVGNDLELISTEEYCDSSPMLQMIFRRM